MDKWISSVDQARVPDDPLSRLSALETQVRQLLASNIQAQSLSELTSVFGDMDLTELNPLWFGDGSDGDLVVSAGVSAFISDKFFNNLTINGTGSIVSANTRIFVNGILDLSAAPAL